jgi:hypothetical protein
VNVLIENRGFASETAYLKALASPRGDRSHLRRAIRKAVWRGLVHEWSEGGGRHYELSVVGWFLAVSQTPDDPARCGISGEPYERRHVGPPAECSDPKKSVIAGKRGKGAKVTQRGIVR